MNEALLEKKIKAWEDQLLDLGKRNKMISFRESKRATLKILKPSFDELYQQIVVDERELTFQKAIDRDSDVRVYSILSLLDKLSCPLEVNVGDIRADGTLPEIKKTLKHLRAKARLSMDEQGTNILYLVFGFIEWREKGNRNENWIRSPLILVPVTLTLPSLNSQYILKKHEDEVVVNPTLAYLFERDYGISLPEFDSDKDTLEGFVQKMEALVDDRGWRVVRDCSMGLVSFLKISMYNDLIKNEAQLKANSILRAFAGERNEVNSVDSGVFEFDHDACRSVDSFQVLDADSSQQDAIALSQKGVSFVMQGPPGTGKSQTITNIIAQALADGKKILFVSEKMAALDVVYRRLTDVHLADFCLSLHSHKANKKEILNQLGANLDLRRIKVKDEEIAKLTRLDVVRGQLKAYAHDIHQTIMPLEMSLYEVYGSISELGALPDIEIHLANVDKLTKDDVNRLSLLVMDLDKAQSVLGPQWYKNPWQGITTSYLEVSQKRDLQNKLQDAVRVLSPLEECTLEEKSLADILSVYTLDAFWKLYEHASHCRTIPNSWFRRPIEHEEQIVRNLREQKKKIDNLSQVLADKYDHEFFALSGESLALQLVSAVEEYKDLLRNKESEDVAFELMEDDFQQVLLLKEFDDLLIDALKVLSTEYKLQVPCVYASVEVILTICEMLLERRKLTEWYFSESNVNQLSQYVTELQNTLSSFVELRQKLCKRYCDNILQIPDAEYILEEYITAETELSDLILPESMSFSGLCSIASFDSEVLKRIDDALHSHAFETMPNVCGLPNPATLEDVETQISVIEKVQHANVVPCWQFAVERSKAAQLLQDIMSKSHELADKRERLKEVFQQFGITIGIDTLTEHDIHKLQLASEVVPEVTTIVSSCNNDKAYQLLETIKQNTEQHALLVKSITTLRDEYFISDALDNSELLAALRNCRDAVKLSLPCSAWTTSKLDAVSVVEQAILLSGNLKVYHTQLLNECTETIFTLDCIGLVNRFANEYIADKKELREFFIRAGIAPDIETISEQDVSKLQYADRDIPEASSIVFCCNNEDTYHLLDMIEKKATEYASVAERINAFRVEYHVKETIDNYTLLTSLHNCRDQALLSNPYSAWATSKQDAIALVEQASILADNLMNQRTMLLETYEDSVFSLDYSGMLNRFKTEYTNVLKVFKSSYKEDLKQIRLASKHIRKKIQDDEIVELLQILRRYHEDLNRYHSIAPRISELLNVQEYDIRFDWNSVKEQIIAFDTVGKIFQSDAATYRFIVDGCWNRIYETLAIYNELNTWFEENDMAKKLFATLYVGANTDTKKLRDVLNHARSMCSLFISPDHYLRYIQSSNKGPHATLAIQHMRSFTFFKSSYKEDVEEIRRAFKDPCRKTTDEEILALLKILKQYNEDVEQYRNLAPQISKLLNVKEYDIWFDWNPIKEQLDLFNTVGQLFQNDSAAYKFIIENRWACIYDVLTIYDNLTTWFADNDEARKYYADLYCGTETDTAKIRDILTHVHSMCNIFVSPSHYIEYVCSCVESQLGVTATQCAADIVAVKSWFATKAAEIIEYTGIEYTENFDGWREILAQLDVFESIAVTVGEIAGYAMVTKYRADHTFIDNYLEALVSITKISEYAELVHYVAAGTNGFKMLQVKCLLADVRTIISLASWLHSVYITLSDYCPDEYSTLSTNDIKADLNSVILYQHTRDKVPAIEEEARIKLGKEYKGLDTNWESVHSNILFGNKVLQLLSGDISPELKTAFVAGTMLYSDTQVSELRQYYISASEIDATYPELAKYKDLNAKTALLEGMCATLDTAIKIKNIVSAASYSKTSYSETVEDLKALAHLQKMQSAFNDGLVQAKSVLPAMSLGFDTDWDYTAEIFNHLRQVKRIISTGSFDSEIVQFITNGIPGVSLVAYHSQIEKLMKNKQLVTEITRLFANRTTMESYNLAKLVRRFRNCNEQFGTMDAWIDLRDCQKACAENGLKDFITTAEDTYYPPGRLKDVFLKAFYYAWFENVCREIESVSTFRVRTQESRVEDFRNLDSHRLPVDQMRIRERLIREMPTRQTSGRATDEMSTLLHELGKKRNIMPLRKLFKTIPNLLLKLKPCLMMSPLSVAYFLEAETYRFDIVIFDEASQIFPQDAIGAIFRAKQVIIAGDSKQLPPTNFFSTSTSNDADFDIEDEDEEEIIFDSILEEASNSLPNRSLLWHYRSRFEELISFSNQHIYQNNLITFPSSTVEVADTGVEYVYVQNGVYENRCNRAEAQEIVRMVAEHIKKYPERSLGVIAFSESQQSVIEDEINKFRMSNPFNERFFNEEKDEPFFVKNLENVQGDERDTIIFSICYAKNMQGRMYMRFGPLGHQGGERRLNVAITRAKHNIKLVGSILPEDIDLSKTHSEGVRMLRSYISFAMHGSSVLTKPEKKNRLYDSDTFSEEVGKFLKSHGCSVRMNVGSSDYTIDIAVEHPKMPGRYIAGIECDGSSYYMARTVRDREHLRSSVLEQMGWRMYRVWSTEWIRNPEAEKDRLINFIQNALLHHGESVIDVHHGRDTHDTIGTEIVQAEASVHPRHATDPYDFPLYEEGNLWDSSTSRGNDNLSQIADMVHAVVKVEQPMHMELLYKRVSQGFTTGKVTQAVRDTIDLAIDERMQGEVVIEDQFIRLTSLETVQARKSRPGASDRTIEHISIPEIAAAMETILVGAYGMDRNILCSEAARVFGFERSGAKIKQRTNEAVDYLIRNKKVSDYDDKIQLLEG